MHWRYHAGSCCRQTYCDAISRWPSCAGPVLLTLVASDSSQKPTFATLSVLLTCRVTTALLRRCLIKGIKNGCPCIVEIRGTQDCALVGDPARAVAKAQPCVPLILNPFYNMKCKIVKKIRQNTTWIEVDILGINLTSNRYNALAPVIVYINNDITTPFNSVTSQ